MKLEQDRAVDGFAPAGGTIIACSCHLLKFEYPALHLNYLCLPVFLTPRLTSVRGGRRCSLRRVFSVTVEPYKG